jgi:hypothetical protein
LVSSDTSKAMITSAEESAGRPMWGRPSSIWGEPADSPATLSPYGVGGQLAVSPFSEKLATSMVRNTWLVSETACSSRRKVFR